MRTVDAVRHVVALLNRLCTHTYLQYMHAALCLIVGAEEQERAEKEKALQEEQQRLKLQKEHDIAVMNMEKAVEESGIKGMSCNYINDCNLKRIYNYRARTWRVHTNLGFHRMGFLCCWADTGFEEKTVEESTRFWKNWWTRNGKSYTRRRCFCRIILQTLSGVCARGGGMG